MYTLTDSAVWKGRTDSESIEAMFRLHQVVKRENLPLFHENQNESTAGIVGFKSDEGVRRNMGRVGAYEAPEEIRKGLASLPYHASLPPKLFDFGNISCEGKQLEEAQEELGKAVSKLLNHNIFPVILGGGHEVAYGHFLGIKDYIPDKETIGIINIDAHFDMRSYDDLTSSGTMFKQILDNNENCQYLCLGIQKSGNTRQLFETANSYGCDYLLEEDIHAGNLNQVYEKVDQFINKNDHIMLTLCSDVLNASFAPGVSAPSPFGMDPKIVKYIIRHVLSHNKTLGFDIAEINPSLDEGGRTVKLAAHMVYDVISNLGTDEGP